MKRCFPNDHGAIVHAAMYDLATIESGQLVPIPDFGGPSYVRKNHPAAALCAPCETPEYGTPAWDEAERKRALIIASNAKESTP